MNKNDLLVTLHAYLQYRLYSRFLMTQVLTYSRFLYHRVKLELRSQACFQMVLSPHTWGRGDTHPTILIQSAQSLPYRSHAAASLGQPSLHEGLLTQLTHLLLSSKFSHRNQAQYAEILQLVLNLWVMTPLGAPNDPFMSDIAL